MTGIAMLDIVIVLILVGGTLNGLRIGAIRQLASLIIFYISMILTARFYYLLLPYVNSLLTGAPTVIVESVIFTVMLLLTFVVLSVLILGVALNQQTERRGTGFNWRQPEDTSGQALLNTLNHLGGIAVGFLTVSLWIGIFLLIYSFVLSSSWVEWESYRHRLLRDYQLSMLMPVFRTFLPYFLQTIQPWLPGGLPAMFRAL